jgi:hypothetical protein
VTRFVHVWPQALQPQRWRASWRVLRVPFLITFLARQRGQRGMAELVGNMIGIGGMKGWLLQS